MKLEKDTTISHYKILSEIGKGGMGAVYLAQDTTLNRKVAIKFLSDELSQDSEKLNRFIQEAQAASALNHPNILTIYEIGESEEGNFIVTEHIDGKTLSDVIDGDGLEVRKALNFAIQITSALATAHDAGIIHRDIKSSNVMIRNDGIVKLLDFGLAKLTQRDPAKEFDSEAATLAKVVTLPGTLMGTPTYMSPEQARGKELDARTDIFSFGILLFEMLTRKRPFTGESYADIMGSILRDEAPPLSRYLEDVPPELDHILVKTLRKDRDQRYQNVKDLVIDLKDFKDELKFEAKLIHSTDSTKSTDRIHKTDEAAPVSTMQITAENEISSRFSILHVFGIFAAVAALSAGGWWYLVRGTSDSSISTAVSFKKSEIISWNSAPGEIFSIGDFSPDGKMIAFDTAESGSRDIWIKQTGEGAAIQVTKDLFNNENPVWSPKGNEIAYFSDRRNTSAKQSGETTGIWRIPILGGTPTLVVAEDDGRTRLRAWSKTGKIYYEANRNLFAVDVKTNKSIQLTEFSKKSSLNQFICISPDEKQIAFARKDGKEWRLYVSVVMGGEPRLVAPVSTKITGIVWHPDGKKILYSAKVDRTIQIFSASISDAESERITFENSDHHVADISADGSSVLFGSAKEESNLWKVNLATTEEISIASSIDSELWSSISPDNTKIAFQSIKNLSQGNNLKNGSILVKTLGSESQSLKIADEGLLPLWSPDGERIAFIRDVGGKSEIWSINDSGGKELKLTAGRIPMVGYSVSPYNQIETSNFQWSPDGKSIAYVSDRNGFQNIWIVASDGSSDTIVTKNRDDNLRYYCPLWSRDGLKIAYSIRPRKPNAEGKSLISFYTVDVPTKKEDKVFEIDSWIRLVGWSEDDKGLILASSTKKFRVLPPEVVLSKADIGDGRQKSIATLKDSYYYNIQISPNRRQIAYVSHQDGKDNLLLIDSKGNRVRQLTNNSDPNLYFSSLSWSPDGSAIFFGKQKRYSLLSMITNFR